VSDFEDWNADMDAWGLVDSQRTHHLWRLHTYHRRLMDWHWRKYERTDVVQAWFALALVVSLCVGLLVMAS
jgi:hypothetical protein